MGADVVGIAETVGCGVGSDDVGFRVGAGFGTGVGVGVGADVGNGSIAM